MGVYLERRYPMLLRTIEDGGYLVSRLKTGIVFANGLGDSILALPTLRAISSVLRGPVTLATSFGPADIIFADVGFDEIVKVPLVEPNPTDRGYLCPQLTAKAVFESECLVFLASGWHERHQEVSALAKAGWTMGLCGEYDFETGYDPAAHSVDRTFTLAKVFDNSLIVEDFCAPFPLPAKFEKAARDLRNAVGADMKLLVVQEETATDEKCWHPDYFQKCLIEITKRHPDVFVLVLSRDGPRFDISPLSDRMYSIDNIRFPFFASIISKADAFLGVDSVGIHCADLWNIPAVGLFGPTSPQEWGFRFTNVGKHIYGDGSMENISIERVITAVSSILQESVIH